ncbi:hypothetical protein B0A48_03815 [Cryoendolithus antarcticus]|uniref:Uncharacterized protein n=1 Tax=Cryoendolithus antarcticus TaxID=1507870 RepID=A0A1V8TGY3_9PEZI|nr:hypothetical protein B0A48_03815 [Cryoendolithus antarcticus]
MVETRSRRIARLATSATVFRYLDLPAELQLRKLHYANDFRRDCTSHGDSRNAEEGNNRFLLRKWLQLVPRGRILNLKLTMVCEETRDYDKWHKRIARSRWASVIASFTHD